MNDTQDNLAQDNSNVELTTENSTVTEFDNVFLVVTQKDVRPADITADTSSETRIDDVCLMFSSYDSAMDSFTNPKHTFEVYTLVRSIAQRLWTDTKESQL